VQVFSTTFSKSAVRARVGKKPNKGSGVEPPAGRVHFPVVMFQPLAAHTALHRRKNTKGNIKQQDVRTVTQRKEMQRSRRSCSKWKN
jgi:hypothetical protein